MKTHLVIDKLNEAVSLEFGAFHMYLQFSLVVHGTERIKWHEFFEGQSKEALGHAKLFAGKVVALGGVPTVVPANFKQSQDLQEMLKIASETESRAVQIYTSIHTLVEGRDKPLQYLLEQQIQDEQQDVEEIGRFLRQTKLGTTAGARAVRSKSSASVAMHSA